MLANLVFLVLAVIAFRWATRAATWPPELDHPRGEVLFSDAEQPTAEDLELLNELVTEIAVNDPVIIGLLDGQRWPEPEIGPAYWTQQGPESRSVLIGGSFRLELDEATYQGPWPSAGCTGGRYRGTVRSVDAVGLRDVVVVVDLTFQRVTNLSIPPQWKSATTEEASPQTVIHYDEDLAEAPWYTGTCPRFSFGE